ncbi:MULTISPECIES: COP23 domain-containing protein [unclassified Nodularia (in: cyanobacteria)]|uniref:COP23 domain-containing protein n=1 Tax=unclassified Nodularia (in: cyanobacteria) TaxID=2656917 RepID=UPI00188254ED|nr:MULTISPECIES: COP23 domain-containing protein [unclassified Nodularia (in: cyanobacteria)]MBE9199382.1 hypothetical protein [Nodularia sp. LEGE 06071]MCC2695084.1 hypothetical protein [Nodularia sp. LEGE 04288]
MKLNLRLQILLGLSIAPILALVLHQPGYAQQKYRCNLRGKNPTTEVRTRRGWEPMLLWESNFFDATISKQERCRIVSNRLQGYDDHKMIPYLTSRRNVNGYPVLCILDRVSKQCSQKDVVVTLIPRTDPGVVLTQVRYFRRGAAGARGVSLSGSNTVFYRDGNFYVNLNQLLEEDN